jgi:hypothetical protein
MSKLSIKGPRLSIKGLGKALLNARSFVERELNGKLYKIDATGKKVEVIFACPIATAGKIESLPSVMLEVLREIFPSSFIYKQTIDDVIKDGSICIGEYFVNIRQIMDEMRNQIKLICSYGSDCH